MQAACVLTFAMTVALSTVQFLTAVDQLIFVQTQKWDAQDGEKIRSPDSFKAQLKDHFSGSTAHCGKILAEGGDSENCLPGRSDYQRGGSPLLCEMFADIEDKIDFPPGGTLALACKN